MCMWQIELGEWYPTRHSCKQLLDLWDWVSVYLHGSVFCHLIITAYPHWAIAFDYGCSHSTVSLVWCPPSLILLVRPSPSVVGKMGQALTCENMDAPAGLLESLLSHLHFDVIMTNKYTVTTNKSNLGTPAVFWSIVTIFSSKFSLTGGGLYITFHWLYLVLHRVREQGQGTIASNVVRHPELWPTP